MCTFEVHIRFLAEDEWIGHKIHTNAHLDQFEVECSGRLMRARRLFFDLQFLDRLSLSLWSVQSHCQFGQGITTSKQVQLGEFCQIWLCGLQSCI